jgi:hypothetical protein
MTLDQIRKAGILVEANRILLHPAGYSLEIIAPNDPESRPYLRVTQDDDTEGGLVFADDTIITHGEKMRAVSDAFQARTAALRPAREKRLPSNYVQSLSTGE